uniref:Uncharacterized protein n=1 Tax=Arundo donax TaxID=35708 RepID=A0A0A9EHG4_ARUDO
MQKPSCCSHCRA